MKKHLFFFLSLTILTVLGMSASAPKYIFMFIGDGMGMGHIMATETYNRLTLGNKQPILMLQFPVASFALTYSANSPITDSAAAGTALAAGYKTNNGMIGMLPDSTKVYSVATELQKKGYGVGVVTSVAFDDATPASYYAHQPSRKMFEPICADGARSGFNFIGGAYTHVAEKHPERCEAVFDDFRNHGYTVAHGFDELRKAKPNDKILLTSDKPVTPNEVGYTIDSIPGAMKLTDMTRACLNHLQRVSPDHFFMMVEGGNIDHAGHGNDGGAVVKEVLNYNDCLRIAYDFYLQHPDETLIIVTAAHDTGGLTVGLKDGENKPTYKGIDYQRISKEQFNDFCVKNEKFTWQQMKQALSEKLGLWSHIGISKEEEARIEEGFNRMKSHSDGSQKTLYKEFGNFTAIVFDILNHKNGFGFTTFSHTGNPVPVFAIGEGSELFKSDNNNINIPAKIRKIAEIND